MSRIKFLAFVGLSLVLFSCQKWKEPTDVDFYVDMDKSATLNNQLIFTTGQIVIESFDFDADREKGDDVLFEQEYSAGLIMPFDPNNQVTELDFVIPQGVYKRVDIGFRTFDDGNDQLASILVEGTYSYTGGGSAPFKFEFTDSQEYKIRAEN